MGVCGLNYSGSVQGPGLCSCEHGNERMSNCWIKDYAMKTYEGTDV
jgi:hypothetical protein